jgi:hydrogenase 3 maturation protease
MKAAGGCTLASRIAVVGMGHELRGDDAAGVAVARILRSALGDSEHLLVIDAGAAPENHTGPLRRFQPDVVLFVDAAQMDEAPGTIRWLSWHEAEGLGAFTHTLSPRVLASFLTSELDCKVALLGIQPADDAAIDALTPEVEEAVDTVVLSLLRVLSRDWVLDSALRAA